MNHFAINWYEKEKKAKEEQYSKSQISLLNRQLQSLLNTIEHQIEKGDYQLQVNCAERILVSSSIWNIRYANNMENKEVVVEQGVLLSLIIEMEKSISHRNHIQQELDRCMRQLGNIDWGLYGSYGKRVQMIRHYDKIETLKIDRVF